MAVEINLGKITLTRLRNYHWEVSIARGGDDKPMAQITEVFIRTTEDYDKADPVGQQRLPLQLAAFEQIAINKLFKKYLLAAAAAQQVAIDLSAEDLPPE